MNAIAGKIVAALSLEETHIWRSKLVDKCAEAERHILKLLESAGANCQPKAPLSQKIETLKTALSDRARLPNPPVTLLKLLEELRRFSDLRSVLVHSTVSMATVEDETVAVFRCAGEQKEGSGGRHIMTIDCLKAAHKGTSVVANKLKQTADALK